MQESLNEINRRNWADWSLEKIDIGFEEVSVLVRSDGGGRTANISCGDYIGVEMLGQWDESIIEDINVEPGGKLASDSIETVKEHYGENPSVPGCNKHLDGEWVQLDVKLIDGVHFRVACGSVELSETGGAPGQET
jgi:hypothetical protein